MTFLINKYYPWFMEKKDIRPLHEIKRQHVIDSLRACGGNKADCAKLLEISYKGLRNLVIKYGIVDEEEIKDQDPFEEIEQKNKKHNSSNNGVSNWHRKGL
jgi:hypothetical protein